MIPGLNPQAVKKLMKQMNMQQIDATEVIIKTVTKELVIKNPEVVKMNVMGKDSFQVTGNVEERGSKAEISAEDVKMVTEKANVSEEKARQALEKSNGDIAQAILSLEGESA